ncbi:metal ABC transporter substrate-binding protein [Chitinivibrio alkaliphilus]|uniref:ABC transporter, metal binding protein n=1 Tax=Chitinivibrio alkaliphilus ACht1 TaxID=1313304 RepID=U7DBG8_9BACT|nr:metal ABC transporter substrate-binding protein [Chitinivibrio alkaliphilus]ERP39362.1 ABC transporter, metal binding protein [Chitinivibrio alkaliphilus ACht1]
MKKLLFFGIFVAILLWGCSPSGDQSNEAGLTVQTTLFPLYDFARNIGGERVQVNLLLPPGVSPHSYEPSPRDMVAIDQADLLLYLGRSLDPWVERLLSEQRQEKALAVSTNLSLLDTRSDHSHGDHDHSHGDHDHSHGDHDHSHGDHDHSHGDHDHSHGDHDHSHGDHDHSHGDHDHSHGKYDPHVWLDPIHAITMVETITEAFIQKDPAGREYYENRSKNYISELEELHRMAQEKLASHEGKTILYAGHFAFGYFSRRYNLAHTSPFRGFSPNAEPSPRAVERIIQRVEEEEARTIFFEEMLNPALAEMISEETGTEIALLHGLHNIRRDEVGERATYLSIMKNNIQKLADGL